MPKILHLADLHLGAAYDSLPDEAAQICRDAQLAALDRALQYANDWEADAVLLAGDLFDSPTPPAALAAQTLALLAKARCPVLISPGNHDYLCPESPYYRDDLPENVHVFDTPQLEFYPLDAETLVWGAAFCGTSANIALDAALPPNKCNILLVHADLLADSGYNPLTPEKLKGSGFIYAALGHNHAFSGLRCTGDTVYACPGSLMGRTLLETGPRGYLYGTVTREGVDLKWTEGGGVSFVALVQPMAGIPDDRALGKAVAAQIPENHSNACAMLTLTGERVYEPDLAALQRALRQVFLSATVRDQSLRPRDPWRYAEEDDLRGAVTRRFRKASESETEESRAATLFALQVALAALDGEPFPSLHP